MDVVDAQNAVVARCTLVESSLYATGAGVGICMHLARNGPELTNDVPQEQCHVDALLVHHRPCGDRCPMTVGDRCPKAAVENWHLITADDREVVPVHSSSAGSVWPLAQQQRCSSRILGAVLHPLPCAGDRSPTAHAGDRYPTLSATQHSQASGDRHAAAAAGCAGVDDARRRQPG